MSDDTPSKIIMYSTCWCPDCLRAKFVLTRLSVPFEEIDIDKDKAGYKIVVDHNGGRRIVPTIFFPDGSALVEPSSEALREKVFALGLAQKD